MILVARRNSTNLFMAWNHMPGTTATHPVGIIHYEVNPNHRNGVIALYRMRKYNGNSI